MKVMRNKSVETNRRRGFLVDAGRRSDSASCDPPFLSAVVAHVWRSASTINGGIEKWVQTHSSHFLESSCFSIQKTKMRLMPAVTRQIRDA